MQDVLRDTVGEQQHGLAQARAEERLVPDDENPQRVLDLGSSGVLRRLGRRVLPSSDGPAGATKAVAATKVTTPSHVAIQEATTMGTKYAIVPSTKRKALSSFWSGLRTRPSSHRVRPGARR